MNSKYPLPLYPLHLKGVCTLGPSPFEKKGRGRISSDAAGVVSLIATACEITGVVCERLDMGRQAGRQAGRRAGESMDVGVGPSDYDQARGRVSKATKASLLAFLHQSSLQLPHYACMRCDARHQKDEAETKKCQPACLARR